MRTLLTFILLGLLIILWLSYMSKGQTINIQDPSILPYVILSLVVIAGIFYSVREGFSSSGLTISDEYCTKLADVYVDAGNRNPDFREDYKKRVCGHNRRNTIDHITGNYFTENGVLI